MNSSQMELGELIIFQPVLQAYPTRHSWIITTHISLGNLACQWKLFCHTITEFQPTTDTYMTLEEFTAFLWRCPQLAHRNCHHKRHSQHQNKNKPTHCHADITTQHPGPYCVNIECHQICHTSQ